MALKFFNKYPLTLFKSSTQTVLRIGALLKNRLFSLTLATGVFVCIGYAQPSAQQTGAFAVKESYPLIFKDFQNREVKNDLIRFFENNFGDLIADIETSTTRQELPALVEFLKTEFDQYANVLPMKHDNPGELNNWIAYKQKEYHCMILGRKIQKSPKSADMEQTIEKYKSRLGSLLAQLLEIKLAKEQIDIDDLEKRLEKLKKIHQFRIKHKKKILQNRFDELVGDKQLYQW